MSDPLLNPWVVTPITIGLIALSAFFVVIEFALLGARRHRLQERADRSPAARAALRGINELTLMLACAQLGITACTFALGAITKPAVDVWLQPVLRSAGAPEWLAGGAAFVISLFVVTFLHLVVGEMAPKSWAIAHPEAAALAVGLPARAYIWPLRPLLGWVNRIANRMVRASGFNPVDTVAVGGQDIATIRQLVEHSAVVGTLEAGVQRPISGLIDLGSTPLSALLVDAAVPTQVPADATAAEVRAAARRSGHLRILLLTDDPAAPAVVHVRDTLLDPDDRPAAERARTAFVLDAATPVYEALTRMREHSVQLTVVVDRGSVRGVVTLADILTRVVPASDPTSDPASDPMSDPASAPA